MRALTSHRLSRGTAATVAVVVQVLVLWVIVASLGSQPQQPAASMPSMQISLLHETALRPQPPPIRPPLRRLGADLGSSMPFVAVEIQPPPSAQPESQERVLRLAGSSMTQRPGGSAGAGAGVGAAGAAAESGIGVLSRVQPDYPLEAVLDNIEGTTSVAILVDERGRPSRVEVLHSSGDAELDRAALNAVRRWKFSAATVSAQPVRRWGRVEVDFSLAAFQRQLLGSGAIEPGAHGSAAALNRLLTLWRGGWMARARLRARAAEYARAEQLRTPEISALLSRRGSVRGIRFLGPAPHAPQLGSARQAGRLRELQGDSIVRWDVFEITQLRGRSQWYVAVAVDGSIADIEVGSS